MKGSLKASQLRDQTAEELRDKERDLSEQLFALRLQKVTGQLEKPARVRQVRKDLARVLTVLHERREGR
jgi:large subunit ribosomal protein L29